MLRMWNVMFEGTVERGDTVGGHTMPEDKLSIHCMCQPRNLTLWFGHFLPKD